VREFVVSLRTGKRYTVRADRVALPDHQSLALVLRPDSPTGTPATMDHAVAVFDRRLVVSVVAVGHLVSEADEPEVVVADDPDDDIPF
jgi:hypothetical protein